MLKLREESAQNEFGKKLHFENESDSGVALSAPYNARVNFSRWNGLFNTFKDIFFIPMNDFGVRLLRVLTTWNWREQILDGLFDEEDRSFDRGSFTYDAHVNGIFELSFLDGNIRRLFHFREAILNRDLKCRVVCYHEQVEFVQKYLGDLVTLRTGKIDTVENWLDIEPMSLL